MPLKRILILILKAFAIIVITMLCAMLMARIAPPEKGTGFDALRYMLLPLYAGIFSCLIFLAVAVFASKYEKLAFFISLVIGITYTVILFLA